MTNALNHLVIKMEPCQEKVDKKGSKIQTDVIMLQKAVAVIFLDGRY